MTQRFDFGINWKTYLQKGVSEEQVAAACEGLRNLLGLTDLHGMTFLDIGCGSGLSSLAAVRMGAARVVSLDYQPVEKVRSNFSKEG